MKFEPMNLGHGEQPDSLFEVPKGAQKSKLGGMLGMPNMKDMMKMGR